MATKPTLSIVCCVGIALGLATTDVIAADTRCAVLEVFLRGDSERSKEALAFIEKTYGERNGVKLAIRDVAADEEDLDRFYMLADYFKAPNAGLPAFYVSGRFEVGWDANTTPQRLEQALTVEVFVRHGCPRCAAAHPVIFNQLAPRYPGYRFVELDIARSATARNRFDELTRQYRVHASSVPALHYCGQFKVGFLDSGTSFRQWNEILEASTVPCVREPDPSQSQEGN